MDIDISKFEEFVSTLDRLFRCVRNSKFLSKVLSERRMKITFDELELEANKLGYRLEKIQKPISILPCQICGKKRTS